MCAMSRTPPCTIAPTSPWRLPVWAEMPPMLQVGHALDHQHVALLRQIVRLELRHPVDVVARALQRVDALQDVAHGQRRSDDGGARDGRPCTEAPITPTGCRARPWCPR